MVRRARHEGDPRLQELWIDPNVAEGASFPSVLHNSLNDVRDSQKKLIRPKKKMDPGPRGASINLQHSISLSEEARAQTDTFRSEEVAQVARSFLKQSVKVKA